MTISLTSATSESSSFCLFVLQTTRTVALTSAISESSSFCLSVVNITGTVFITSAISESSSFCLFVVHITGTFFITSAISESSSFCHRPPCSEVLCLGNVTFEQGVACLTGSYSMAVRPIEKHPCVVRGKGNQIKYATRWLRALFHAKPNISPISDKDKVQCDFCWV